MDTLLVVVTLVSLVLGLGMALVAWWLLREARTRSAARVEALRAMAFAADPDPRVDDAVVDDEPDEAWDLPIVTAEPAGRFRPETRPAAVVPVGAARLFDPAPASPAGARRMLALATMVLVMLGGFGSVYALRSTGLLTPSALAARLTAPDERSAPALELTSLRNDVTEDGDFIVTGLVHNPVTGVARHGVVAVVYLFDRDGHYFASGRAALELSTFPPGDESPFVVRIPNGAGAIRYRVGFRMEDGGVVAHVDRRGEPPAGTTGDVLDGGPMATPLGGPRRSES
jgi:hypothetical protein